MKESTRGAFGIFLTYVFWGLMPVYWKALASVNSMEILVHRIIWSCVFSFLLIIAIRRTSEVVSLFRSNRRALVMLVLSGVAVSTNWGIYIWAVNDGRILESSLGYFINPLISMLFGVVIFKESLNNAQRLAFGISTAGVCFEIIALGHLPFVSLGLAFTFGIYGLLKKLSATESIVGMAVETLFIAPFALLWLVWRYSGTAHFPDETWTALLLVGTGMVTAVPLIFFAWGVKRCPLTIVGVVQYASPALLFLSATLVYHEPIPPVRLLSFVLIWISIIIFTVDSLRRARNSADLQKVENGLK